MTTSKPAMTVLEKLKSPPIVEAVCGVRFAAPVRLDPVILGAYWHNRRAEFPKYQMHPPILDGGGIILGPTIPRTWLLSEDEALILQMQPDRFYLNWRERGGEYPTFSSEGGLRDKAVSEFEAMCKFSLEITESSPVAGLVEVGKVDHFPWKGKDDAVALMPILKSWLSLGQASLSGLNMRIEEQSGEQRIRLVISIISTATERGPERVLRMETNAWGPAKNDLGAALNEANIRVNEMFQRIIPQDEREQRFGKAQ